MINKLKRYIAVLLLSCFLLSANGDVYGGHLNPGKSEAQFTQQQDTAKVIVKNDKSENDIKNDVKSEEITDKKPSYSSVLSLNFVFYLIYKYTFRDF